MDFLDLNKEYKLEKKDVFGEGAIFHHLGIIVKDKSNSPYSQLIYIYDPNQKVEVAFYNFYGLTIEVVSPKSKDSPIIKALANKVFYHHICFSVPNIKNSLTKCTINGIRRISKISPAVAFGGRNICWCIGRDYGLIELIER